MGRILSGALFWCVLISIAGCEKEKVEENGDSRRKIDTRAARILKEMGDTLGKSASFSFQVWEVWDKPLKSGQMVQYSNERKVLISRPNKLLAEYQGDAGSRTTWYDGKNLTVLEKERNIFAVVAVPETIEKMFDFTFERYHLTIPLADLMFRKPYDILIANVRTGKYAGIHKIGKWSCHHLVFRQDTVDWQIWIDAGKTPVPRKVLIIYRDTPGRPEFSAILDRWDFSPKISPGLFDAKIPTGAKRVDMKELIKVE